MAHSELLSAHAPWSSAFATSPIHPWWGGYMLGFSTPISNHIAAIASSPAPSLSIFAPSCETRVFQSSGPSPLISGSAHPPGFVARLFSVTGLAVNCTGSYEAHGTDHGTLASVTGVLSG